MVLVRGFVATASGKLPTNTVATTVFVRSLITDTESFRLATSMVLVRVLVATPVGAPPTETVAVTLQGEVLAWEVLTGGDDVAAAMVVAIDPSEATAAAIKMTARWVSLMMSCFLAGHADGCLLLLPPALGV